MYDGIVTQLPHYMTRDASLSPFDLRTGENRDTISLEVRPRVFAATFLIHKEEAEFAERVVDDLTKRAKGAIIQHYGLLGEIELRLRHEQSTTMHSLQRMLDRGATLEDVRKFVDFNVSNNERLDYPWRA